MSRYFEQLLAATLALVVAFLLASCGGDKEKKDAPKDAAPAPNILLVTIDTLRADHVQPYGYDPETTPSMSAMAREGVLFESAVSQASWTLPALASIHSSKYPSSHGALHARTKLGGDALTIAEALKKRGYETVGVVAHKFAGRRHGLAQGFDVFDQTLRRRSERRVTSRKLFERAAKRMRSLYPVAARRGARGKGTAGKGGSSGEKPFFLWVHFFDPHYHYVRHDDVGFAKKLLDGLSRRQARKRLSARFVRSQLDRGLVTERFRRYVVGVHDDEIAYTDMWLGRLKRAVEALDNGRPTVSVVTADHGEAFLEHGLFFHGGDVWGELIDVPLIICGDLDPALRGKRVGRTVETRSIPRTIMGLAGGGGEAFEGEDLLALAATKDPEPRPAFSEGTWAWNHDRHRIGVEHDGMKVIRWLKDGRYLMFDLGADPGEKNDLWESDDPDLAKRRAFLKAKIDEYASRRAGVAPVVEMTAADIARLKSLGYIESEDPAVEYDDRDAGPDSGLDGGS